MWLMQGDANMNRVHIAAFNAGDYGDLIRAEFPELEVTVENVKGKATTSFADANVLIGFGPAMTDELVAEATGLKWIQALGTGVDGFDDRVDATKVILSSMRGIHGPQMAEMAFLMMLSFVRRLPFMLENQAHKRWERFTAAKLEGKTAVIIGIGLIADALAARCQAFGLRVLGVSGTPRKVANFDRVYARTDMEAAAAEGDFVILLAPLTDESRGMINRPVFQAMKPSAYFINLARGGVVDERDFVEAMRREQIAGAALDVFVDEPLPETSPLWDLPNVIITPHLGGRTEGYVDQAMPIIRHNFRCYLDGAPGNMKNRVTS